MRRQTNAFLHLQMNSLDVISRHSLLILICFSGNIKMRFVAATLLLIIHFGQVVAVCTKKPVWKLLSILNEPLMC